MAYKVIESFCDMNDHSYQYSAGDNFPRQGAEVSQARLNELSSNNNKLGRPLIKAIAVKPIAVEPAKPITRPRSKKSKKSE